MPKIHADAISTIPSVFFESDFQMENPRIFDLVTENAHVVSSVPSIGMQASSATGAPATTNSLLQEKLSHYLDTVEVHLVAEISCRSHEFFHALANIQSLHAETVECLRNLRMVRSALAAVDQSQAQKGLQVVRQRRRRMNLQQLLKSIKLVKDVKQTQPHIQVFLNHGDYVGAIDLISDATRLLNDVNEHAEQTGLSLRGVRGLIHLNGQLAEMSKMIASLMESDFSQAISSDLQTQTQDEKVKKTIGELLVTFPLPDMNAGLLLIDEDLKHRLAPLILGLLRADRLSAAMQNYREIALKMVKQITKQVTRHQQHLSHFSYIYFSTFLRLYPRKPM
jgi:hypothetical protein